MSDLIVHGGAPLSGAIRPSANKNAVLPILAATLLTHEPVRLERVPEITDARRILELFRAMGSRVEADFDTGVVEIEHRDTTFDVKTMRLPEGMRSSIMLVPPLLVALRRGAHRRRGARAARSACARSIRTSRCSSASARAPTAATTAGVLNVKRPLQAAQHWLDYASVTTTENFVLCARAGARHARCSSTRRASRTCRSSAAS